MATMNRFDPFNDRLCRNVRNALSERFTESLKKGDLRGVRRVADLFLGDSLPACVSDYIRRRLTAYEAVLGKLSHVESENPLDVAFIIWDRHLFFEMHEYLEPFWMVAAGEEKRLIQALIRAAGAYVHLEQGNLAGAARIAGKAIDGLTRCRDRLARHIDPRRLLTKLETLDPVPPVLFGTKGRSTEGAGVE